MTKNEMRFVRREFINEYIRLSDITLFEIRYYVRLLERVNYGYELKVY